MVRRGIVNITEGSPSGASNSNNFGIGDPSSPNPGTSIPTPPPTPPLVYIISGSLSGGGGGSLKAIDTSSMSVYKTATESTSLGALGFDGTYIYAADGSTIYKYTQTLSLVGSSPISFSGSPVIMSYDGTNLLVGDDLGMVYLVSTGLALVASNDLASDESVSIGTYQGITYTGTYWYVGMNGGTDLSASYIFLLDPSSLAIVESVAL